MKVILSCQYYFTLFQNLKWLKLALYQAVIICIH